MLTNKIDRLVRRFHHANWYLGKVVELSGNRVRIDGCVFDVDNSELKTKYKSSLLTGAYEKPERILLRRFLRPQYSVIELGACIGVLSCISNRMLEDPSRHLVVEANQNLLASLEKNRELNNCRFEVKWSAVFYGGQTARFYLNDVFLGSSTESGSGRCVEVPAITLRDIFAEKKWTDTFVICDIEGGEYDMIAKDIDVLKKHVRALLMEVHRDVLGDAKIESMFALLQKNGFSLESHDSTAYLFLRR